MNRPIGLFYGSTTCYTQFVAEQIRDKLGTDKITLHNIAETPLDRCIDYEWLIFGIPTWDYGELQEDWDKRWDELKGLDLRNRRAAVFGLGDQIGYPDWFQDAMGYLYRELEACGAEMVGHWPATGYSYNASAALTEDGKYFLGLALDEENQAGLTASRLDAWLKQINL